MRQKVSNHYPRLTGVTKHIRYPYCAAKCKKKHLANDYWISIRLSQKTTELPAIMTCRIMITSTKIIYRYASIYYSPIESNGIAIDLFGRY